MSGNETFGASYPTNPNINNGSRKRQRIASSQERSIPFNVSMPAPDFDKLQETADKEGISRSELIRRAMQFYYHHKEPKASDQ